MTHPIPAAALAHHVAILGKTGSGKTFAAKGIVEALLEGGSRACIVDPAGVWWGLRRGAAPDVAGFPVVIFGGRQADFPLSADHAEAIAEIVGTSSTPAALDTSTMSVGERTRFFATFADALFRKNRGPLHLVIDEAHLFAPQGRVSDPASSAMLHAANNLVSLGRSRGLRIILISQRPAKLHKDSLTQVETLVTLRLIAPQDRRAVEEWIEDNADGSKRGEILQSLATLKTGTGWIWAPELDVLERVTFPRIRTFDSSAAPDAADEEGASLPPIDREAIAGRIESIVAEAADSDPKALRARIRELEARAAMPRDVIIDTGAVERARQDGYAAGLVDGRAAVGQHRLGNLARVRELLTSALDVLDRPSAEPQAAARDSEPVVTVCPPDAARSPETRAALGELATALSTAAGKRSGGELRVLKVLAQRHPAKFTTAQWATLANLKRTGGTWQTYLSRLNKRGLVERTGDLWNVTPAGLKVAGTVPPAPRGAAAIVEAWCEALGSGAGNMLREVVKSRGRWVERSMLAFALGLAPTGGTFQTYLSRLRTNGLIEIDKQRVRAAEILFGAST